MIKNWTLFLMICFCFNTSGWTQNYFPYIKNFGPRNYGKDQPPENYALIQDQHGLLYFANAGGLIQFDGRNWNFIPVKKGYFVSAVCSDAKGKIYVGTFGEFGFLESHSSGQLTFTSLVRLLPENEQSIGMINRMHCVDETVYFQLEDQIIAYKNGKIYQLKSENSFHLSFNYNNRLLARERYNGLVEITLSKENELKKTLLSDDTLFSEYGIFSILPFEKNQLLIVTQEKGLFIYNESKDSLMPFGKDTKALSAIRFYGGKTYKNGYVLNSLNEGLIYLSKQGELLVRLNLMTGLNSNDIKDVYIDRQDNIWLATAAGISFINITNPFEYFNETNGLEGSIENLIEVNGQLVCGTSEGLFIKTKTDFHFRKIKDFSTHVYAILPHPRDGIWIASNLGLFRYHNESLQLIRKGNFNTLYPLSSETLLLLGNRGISLISTTDGQLLQHEELALSRTLSALKDPTSNEIWVGTAGMGVIRLKLNATQNKIESWDIYDDLDGLAIEYTRPVLINEQVIIISSGGFNKFIREEEVAKSLPDSLKGNPDFERGYFDVYVFNRKHYKDPVSAFRTLNDSMVITCLDNKIHLFINDKDESAIFSSIDAGRINSISVVNSNVYICADEGLIRFSLPQLLSANKHLSDISNYHPLIRSVTDKKNKLYFSSISGQIVSTEIPYSNNTLEFSVALPYFHAQHPITFSWRLVGQDEQWTNFSADDKVRFTNLHEGNYTFEVKGQTIFGIESAISSYHFSIAPPWYRTTWAYGLYFLLFLLIVYLAIRIASYNLKQKNIRLEAIVKERTQEIERKNEELEHSNIQILHQKNEITDSITYAKRIQEAILPIRQEILGHFPKSFVLYKPKDIVSGDFYWFFHQQKISIIICADCTGHGVPGAFMSMICIDKLNHAVHEKRLFNPGSLLKEVSIGIKQSLKQNHQDGSSTRDGMDAAVCIYNHETKELVYAGANRPLWLVREQELIEYKATKSAVGGYTPNDQIFEENNIQLLAGDRIYLSTDGFADQFGGAKGKKMMVRSFKDQILQLQHLPIEQQGDELDKRFENWKNHKDENQEVFEQVDDVCVIGIEF